MAQGPGWIHRRWGWVLKGSVDVDARRRAKGRGVGPSPEAGARLSLTSRRARSLCARALSSHQPLLSTSVSSSSSSSPFPVTPLGLCLCSCPSPGMSLLHFCCNPRCPLRPQGPSRPFPPQDSSTPLSMVFHDTSWCHSHHLSTHTAYLQGCLWMNLSLPHWEGSGSLSRPTGRMGKGTFNYRAALVPARVGHSRILLAFNFSTTLMTWYK